MAEFTVWAEAWMSGYIAHQEGVPEDEHLLEVCAAKWKQSGPERAKQIADALREPSHG